LTIDQVKAQDPIKSAKDTQGPILQLLFTPKAQAQSIMDSRIRQAQFDLGPEESKAQLKWAPATSKDGSDQIHRHQLLIG
jgi:hypothetical protein